MKNTISPEEGAKKSARIIAREYARKRGGRNKDKSTHRVACNTITDIPEAHEKYLLLSIPPSSVLRSLRTQRRPDNGMTTKSSRREKDKRSTQL